MSSCELPFCCFKVAFSWLKYFKIISNDKIKTIYQVWKVQWPNGLVHWTLKRAVQVRAPAGVIVFCSWARHFTVTVPLSAQVYKLVPVNLISL